MAMNLLFAVTFLSLNLMTHSFSPKKLNVSAVDTGDSDWSTAVATYYGAPNGYGTDAGACGYKDDVAKPPFSAMVSAGGPLLFNSGKGCGACYQMKCTSQTSSSCSNNPITVVITDECARCDPIHFDLSTTAYNAMANSGQEIQLQTVGKLQINYRKVACNYNGKTLSFHVKDGSNPYYFAVLVEYVNGVGQIGRVELKQAQQPDTWLSMNQLFGAYWKLDNSPASPLQPPLSLRVTLLDSDKTVEATDVIPVGWQPDTKYVSNVNFQV